MIYCMAECFCWVVKYITYHYRTLEDSVFFQGFYSDATITCDGKFYPVHKLVLSSCSDYFGSIFESTFCKHPVIIIKDIKHEDMEALLNYMYLGEAKVKLSDILRTLVHSYAYYENGNFSPPLTYSWKSLYVTWVFTNVSLRPLDYLLIYICYTFFFLL